jgi:tRNA dimethylallyltransferase
MKKIPLIVITGPTGSGKTDLAIKLAQKFNGEIISADSRQIYKGMDIGTAKLIPDFILKTDSENVYVKNKVKHYLIDVINPNESYDLYNYKKDCKRLIKKIYKNGKLPFLVGGTGLYISSVIENYQLKKDTVNKKIRQELYDLYKEKGLNYLVGLLKKECLELSKKSDFENPRRVIRMLEICRTKGEVKQRKGNLQYDYLLIGVLILRKKLYEKINKRVENMIKKGLVDEVKKLYEKYSLDLTSMSGIGYRQIGKYLKGDIELKEAIRLIKRDTRRYAKRQITWWRGKENINWVINYKEATLLVYDFLKNHGNIK